ncbi:MAG: hypothetical protein K0Q65_1780 [Clostridia bacterium]|nr:hypothetical protein [Clostridia bacterium]
MKEKVKVVIKGFINLTQEERQEFIAEVNKFINGTSMEKTAFQKSLNESYSIDLGPTSGGCPCCGK